MPAILDGEEAIRKWLDFAEVPTQEAVKLIQPTENIVFHPVSTFVNSVRNDTPKCLAPIELGAKKVSAGVGSARIFWGGDSAWGVPEQGQCCQALQGAAATTWARVGCWRAAVPSGFPSLCFQK